MLMTEPISQREFFDLKFKHLEEKQRELHRATQHQISELSHDIKQLLALERRVAELEQNPSLLWYWRYQPRKTLFWFFLILAVVSLIFISDLRHPIMDALGIPHYQP